MSLRSVAKYMPWVGKVWVFGDRPAFLSNDTSLIQHVPHEYTARVGGFRTPVTNGFLLLFLASLIPELSFEFIWFCDDYILLDEVSEPLIRRDRYLGDLSQVKNRGRADVRHAAAAGLSGAEFRIPHAPLPDQEASVRRLLRPERLRQPGPLVRNAGCDGHHEPRTEN